MGVTFYAKGTGLSNPWQAPGPAGDAGRAFAFTKNLLTWGLEACIEVGVIFHTLLLGLWKSLHGSPFGKDRLGGPDGRRGTEASAGSA